MRATAEPVEGNKVRLSVEIDEAEVDQALDDTVRTIAQQARIPGFRPGKVPRQILEARMGGAQALRSEALREVIPDLYAKALVEAAVDPIAPPEIDITGGEDAGAVSFDAVVEVRPIVGIPGYNGLQATVPSLVVDDAEVDGQVDRMRETEAELVEVSRAATDGDNVTIDLHGDASGQEVVSVDDYLYEVGSGTVVPELDQQLRGAKVGDILQFSAAPAGSPDVAFRVLVKDVKEKKLPDLTDEWAAESSEFETVDALRDDLRARITRVRVLQAQMALRESAVAALVGLVDDDEVPDVLVDEEVRERVHDLSHRLDEQRLSIDQFLQATGRTGDDLVAEVREEARRSVKADLALRALAEVEALDVTDDEFDTELEAMAARMEITSALVREQLAKAGRTAAVRSEQRKAKALTWLIDHIDVVDENGVPIDRADLEVEGAPADGTDAGAEPVDRDQADETEATGEAGR
ncbi:MAG TPA: trigger factor [Acidimicrobiales bacterium]|jgi:trigger factor